MNPLIINVALTGCLFGKKDNPNLPITPEQIADDVAYCKEAGATVFHIHARNDDGKPTWKKGRYQEIIDLIRWFVPDAIICVSCSGRHWSEFEKRAEVLDCKGVDMASLTLGSFNFPMGASVNSPQMIAWLIQRMEERGIKPELEAFDIGQAYFAQILENKQLVDRPLYINLFFGNKGTMPADVVVFMTAIAQLPKDTIWSATGVGRYQFTVNCWAIAHGGHVRVGLEDNPRGTNVDQVCAVANVAKAMGREIATPEQAREMLCLE